MKIKLIVFFLMILCLTLLSGCGCKKTYNTLTEKTCFPPPRANFNNCDCTAACVYHCNDIGWQYEYVNGKNSCGFLGLAECCDCVCSRCS